MGCRSWMSIVDGSFWLYHLGLLSSIVRVLHSPSLLAVRLSAMRHDLQKLQMTFEWLPKIQIRDTNMSSAFGEGYSQLFSEAADSTVHSLRCAWKLWYSLPEMLCEITGSPSQSLLTTNWSFSGFKVIPSLVTLCCAIPSRWTTPLCSRVLENLCIKGDKITLKRVWWKGIVPGYWEWQLCVECIWQWGSYHGDKIPWEFFSVFRVFCVLGW